MSRPSGARHRNQPSAARALDLAAAVLSAGDESQVLKRLAPLAALPAGLGLGRAFLLLADSERAVLAGRVAIGPADEAEAARMPQASEAQPFDLLDALTDEALESAAPELTARVRGLALPLRRASTRWSTCSSRAGPRASTTAPTRGATRSAPSPSSRSPWSPSAVRSRCSSPTRASPPAPRRRGARPARRLARVAGLAIERARLEAERIERAAQLATLEELAKSAIAPTSLRSELALVVRPGAQALSCRGAVLWRVPTGNGANALVLETVHVSDERMDPLRRAEALEPLARAVLRHRAPRAIADASADPHLDPAAVRGMGASTCRPCSCPAARSACWPSSGRRPRALGADGLRPRGRARCRGDGRPGRRRARAGHAVDRVRAAEARLAELAKHVASNERLAALGAIAARAAEEAQHPLASIGGFARACHRGLPAEDPNREYVEIILREADRLERLLAEHRQFASLSRPRLALESVNQILVGTLTALSDGMVKRRVRLLKKLAPDVPSLLLDAEKIRQVVRNMLEHALEAVPQGGRVKVETRKSQGYVVVEIASDAPPLSGDMLEQLFVPFATSRKGGDPVGLALAQQVVQSHGGEIRVRSEGDWGVIFSFTLPVVENADRRARSDRRGVRMDRRNRFPAA
jgi:signal transduction histidine kinase